jgi:WD40-like Beta Propeller Repeat
MILAACGRIGFAPETSGDGAVDGAMNGAACGPWSAPSLLAAQSSSVDDLGPELAPDGLTLYFHSTRGNGNRIFRATRETRADPFGPPTLVDELTVAGQQRDPTLARGGVRLYLSLDLQLFASVLVGARFTTPVRVTEINGGVGPEVTADDLELWFGPLVRATRTRITDPWTVIGPVVELAPEPGDGFASLSADALTVYFETSRDMVSHVYTATRPDRDAAFSPPVPFEPANGGTSIDPEISSDGRELYFAGVRTDGVGGPDLYVVTRDCE